MHEFRGLRAKRETPRGMYRVAIAIAVLSVLNFALDLNRPEIFVLHMVVAAIIAGAATIIHLPSFPPGAVASVVGACTALFTAELQLEVWLDPTPLGYVYVAMATLGSATLVLGPRVLAVYSVVNLTGAVIIAFADPWVLAPARPLDWIIAVVSTLIVGAIFMFQRLRSIDELGVAMAAIADTATHDPLTTLLNRCGLEEMLPALANRARTDGEPLFACFVDIDWLKTANDTHGHEFGDEIIRTVGAAIVSELPADALIARWGGDEFLGIGIGQHPEMADLEQRIRARIATSGIDLTKWAGTVSIGSASLRSQQGSIDDLIRLADEHMYGQRRERRNH